MKLNKIESLREIKRFRDLRDRAIRHAAQALFSRKWDTALALVQEAREHDEQAERVAADVLYRFYADEVMSA